MTTYIDGRCPSYPINPIEGASGNRIAGIWAQIHGMRMTLQPFVTGDFDLDERTKDRVDLYAAQVNQYAYKFDYLIGLATEAVRNSEVDSALRSDWEKFIHESAIGFTKAKKLCDEMIDVIRGFYK